MFLTVKNNEQYNFETSNFETVLCIDFIIVDVVVVIMVAVIFCGLIWVVNPFQANVLKRFKMFLLCKEKIYRQFTWKELL